MPDGKEKNIIRFNTDIDPRTDPNSPQFDVSAAFNALGSYGMTEARERFNKHFESIANSLKNSNFSESAADITALLQKVVFSLTADAIAKAPDQSLEIIADFAERMGVLIDENDPNAFTLSIDRDEQKTTTATARRADIIEYPIDRVNNVIWGLLERDTAGQIAIAAEKRGSNKEISILYSINFDNLGDEVTISKRLLPFDKRVYIAVSALFNAGNNVISLTQIHYAMGNTSRPKAGQLQRINEAIKKMNGAAITVDNSQEIAANYKYMQFKYEGSLLPLERIEASVNGQLTDAAIHIFREPPVITFAKKRNQITTIPVKLLQSPMNKTDANLQLEDYLLERISREARGKGNGKTARLLYKTIFDHAGISSAKQKQRAPEKIEKYLKYYTETNFIKGYAMEADGVTIIFA